MVSVGIDEVGRGCWAGPLVVGAVIMSRPIDGVKDSKLLSRTQRENLATQILAEAKDSGLGWVSPKEVDELGLSAATTLAIQRALLQIQIDYDEIIIDGNINYLQQDPRARAVIKADNLYPAVSAASIIAKVARDNYMREMAINYPNYAFEQHVGYGTSLHLARLKEFGVSSLHRLSFKPVAALGKANAD